MTEELKQLREALRRVKHEAASLADAQVIALEALTQRPAAQTWDKNADVCKGAWELGTACGTCAKCIATKPAQRPAAQTEREADGLPLIVAGAIFDFAGFMTTRSEVIEVGSTAEAGPVADLVKEWAELRGLDLADAAVLSWQLHITRASLPTTQQATPEPECARSHPHEDMSATCELRTEIARLRNENTRLKAATPEPVQLDVVRQAIEERDAMESRYHELAKSMTYKGNSVAWWHSKATAYRNAIDEVWSALKAAGIYADGAKTCADGVRELAATPEPVGGVVAWWYLEDGEVKFGHPNGHRPTDARPLVFGDTRPAPGVPEDVQRNAARWEEVLRQVGADHQCGGFRFTLYNLRPIPGSSPMQGAVCQHFTQAVDAAAAAAQAKGADK